MGAPCKYSINNYSFTCYSIGKPISVKARFPLAVPTVQNDCFNQRFWFLSFTTLDVFAINSIICNPAKSSAQCNLTTREFINHIWNIKSPKSESELAHVVFSIKQILLWNFLCISLFWAALKLLYLWNRKVHFDGFFNRIQL